MTLTESQFYNAVLDRCALDRVGVSQSPHSETAEILTCRARK